MLHKLPKHLPDWASILADIGNPSTAQLAAALGVSKRTVERWNHTGAPRTAVLSVWWLSVYGYSFLDHLWAEEHRQTRLHNRVLLNQVDQLSAKLHGNAGVTPMNAARPEANDPVFLVDQLGNDRSPGGPVPAQAHTIKMLMERHFGGVAAPRNDQRA